MAQATHLLSLRVGEGVSCEARARYLRGFWRGAAEDSF